MSVASMGTFFDLNGNAEYVRGTSRASTLSARLMHRVEKKKKARRNLSKQINRSYIISYLQSRVLITQHDSSQWNLRIVQPFTYPLDRNEDGNEGRSDKRERRDKAIFFHSRAIIDKPLSLFSKKRKKNLRNGSRPTTPKLCASIRSEASISREGSLSKSITGRLLSLKPGLPPSLPICHLYGPLLAESYASPIRDLHPAFMRQRKISHKFSPCQERAFFPFRDRSSLFPVFAPLPSRVSLSPPLLRTDI